MIPELIVALAINLGENIALRHNLTGKTADRTTLQVAADQTLMCHRSHIPTKDPIKFTSRLLSEWQNSGMNRRVIMHTSTI